MKTTLLTLALTLLVALPASAANKEHQQLMADLRILQEQMQLIQNMQGTLAETIKAVNTRLDEQADVNRRAIASEKLLVETLANDLRVVREKVDDNNVRAGSLSQEVDALRQLVQQALSRLTAAPADPNAPVSTTGNATTPPPVGGAAGSGASPTKMYDQAFSDYTSSLWDLAIDGFEAFLKDFPTSPQAPSAQLWIGRAYVNDGKYEKAVDAFDKLIRTYPMSASVADALYLKGESLRGLKQADGAKEAYDTVIKNYPDSNAAGMARQRIARP